MREEKKKRQERIRGFFQRYSLVVVLLLSLLDQSIHSNGRKERKGEWLKNRWREEGRRGRKGKQ